MNKVSDAMVFSAFCAAGAFGAMEFDNRTQEEVVPQKIECFGSEISDSKACVAEVDRSYQSQYYGAQVLQLAGLAGAIYGGRAVVRIGRDQ
jgi:hypothetical protein